MAWLFEHVPWDICRDKVRELEQALATAQAEHMDYDFLQLQLQEFESTNAQQQKVYTFKVPTDSKHKQWFVRLATSHSVSCLYSGYILGSQQNVPNFHCDMSLIDMCNVTQSTHVAAGTH